MQFDAIRSPIDHGLTLLEAGAGTGKTHSLVRIIARQLVEKGIPIDRIVTVTFTRAATAEIKDRLHHLLAELLDHLKNPPQADINDLAEHWLAQGEEIITEAKSRLSIALASFDSAPIFTIDGFFQRLMKEYAFEALVPFSVELEKDEAALVDTALRDYWRQHVYPLSGNALDSFGKHIKFDDVKKFVAEALRNSDAVLAPDYAAVPADQLAAFAAQWQPFVALLAKNRAALAAFVKNPPAGIKKAKTPFRKGTTEKFLAEVDAVIADPETVPDTLGRLFSVAATTLFDEAAFNKDKFIDLRGHALAGLFQAVDTIGEALPKDLDSGYSGAIYRYVAEHLEHLKAERMVETYNGVTARLAGLPEVAPRQWDEIKTAVNRRYDAVLIDEFQDTSPQQCAVFLNLFHHPERYFHVIGDPKQSIYRFRGADVFSYIKASEKADQRYDLRVNYRSSPRMIHAVNQLFGRADDPFLVGGRIVFKPARWRGQNDATTTPPGGPPVLFFHEIDLADAKAARLRDAITRSVCKEIADLLGEAWADHVAEKAGHIAPPDIAVLVRTAKEAGPIAEGLAALNVPAALGTRSSLLRSDEAGEVLAVLGALLEPQNAGAIRAALLTAALGSGRRLDDEAQFDRVTDDLAELHATWHARGLLPAMLGLVARFDLRQTLLGLTRGRRRLTNFMHLVELLDRKAREERLGPAAAVGWLEMAVQGSVIDMDSEVLELRIATDAPAVQIITQHTSKGLEFPIVFVLPPCPGDYTYQTPPLSYHDPETLEARIAPRGDKEGTPTFDLRKRETSADQARLAYVALTRAQFRCHLYHLPVKPKKEDEHAVHQMLGCPDDAALTALVAGSDGTVVRAPVGEDIFDENPDPYQPAGPAARPALATRETGGIAIVRRGRTTSFTGITRYAAEGGDAPHDFDPATSGDALPPDSGFWARLQAGASLGIVFHEILEEVDFQSPTDLAALVERKLLTYSPWRDPPGKKGLAEIVGEIEVSVLTLLQHPIAEGFQLAQLAPRQRLNEPRFLLSGSGFTLSALCDILANDPPETLPAGYLDRLRRVPAAQFEGFLDGFIDLIFEHGGRYHLLDWKTNRIAASSPSALADVMAEHHYFLQYHLYGLALDRLLAHRLGTAYDPAQHLGDIYYVFLRGVEPGVTGSGVFTDSFSPARLASLRSAFAGEHLLGEEQPARPR